MKMTLHGLLTEDGSGGFDVNLFDSSSDVLAYQIERNDGKVVDFEDDPYEHGYHETIQLEYEIVNGQIALSKPAHVHFGQ